MCLDTNFVADFKFLKSGFLFKNMGVGTVIINIYTIIKIMSVIRKF